MRKSPESLAELERQLKRRAAANTDGKLIDTEFPPTQPSMGPLDTTGVYWERAAYYAPLLPSSGRPAKQNSVYDLPAGDAEQGKVGDCWFLSAATLVFRRSDLAGRVLLAEHPESGFYIFSFYKEGEWRLVYIDDFLPERRGRPVFASSTSKNPFFRLLEKAYAKARGSYAALSMGSIAYAFTDLTGGVCSLDDVGPETWETIQTALAEGWLVTASPYYQEMTTGKEVGQTGLYANHAYSLNRVARVDGERLLGLRNPWGRLEWKGAWADGDKHWSMNAVSQLGHRFKEDGDFWIDFEDFRRYFTKLIICRLYDDSIGPLWRSATVRGRWDKNSGGNHSLASWWGNPRYRFEISRPSTVFVQLSQEDVEWRERAAVTNRREFFSIGLVVTREENSGGNRKENSADPRGTLQAITAASPNYTNSRDVSLEFSADGGVAYWIVPATFNPGEESNFVLRVLCPIEFKISGAVVSG